MSTKKIVGFDLGTNSVGWAVVENSDENAAKIAGAGSRILPLDPKILDAFENGQKLTKNAERRQKRSQRKTLDRYQLRRKYLIESLIIMGCLPEDFTPQNAGRKFKELIEKPDELKNLPDDWYVYMLRSKALKEPVTQIEFGRILYHLNQRRGYKDIGELMEEIEEKDDTKQGKKYDKWIEQVTIYSVEKKSDLKNKKQEYWVILDDGREGTSIIANIESLTGKEIELEIRRRVKKNSEETFEFALPNRNDWQNKLDALDKQISQSGMHVGEFFWNKIKEDRYFRIRQNFVHREKYIEEFDAIWEKQQEFIPALIDETVKQDVIQRIVRNEKERQKWAKKPLKEFIKNYIIYYQRPLKSQKSKKANCRFEPMIKVINQSTGESLSIENKCMPLSSPLYEEFRIWQKLNNLRYKDINNKNYELTNEQKEALFEKLNNGQTLKESSIFKILGLDKNLYSDFNFDQIEGHTVKSKIASVLKDYDSGKIIGNEEFLYKVWHLLYSVNETEYRKNTLIKWFNLTEEDAKRLAKVRFEKKTGSLSSRAVKKLLPLMRAGKYFDEQSLHDSILFRINNIINGEFDPDVTDDIREFFKEYKSIRDFSGMPYWKAATLVYGSHSTGFSDTRYEKPEEIQLIPAGELRNPVVEQVINETLQIARDIWIKYGKPDEIHLEMAREMKMNSNERQKLTKAMRDQQKKNEEYEEILKKEFNILKPSRTDIIRYRLYIDQKQRCLYTGKPIQKTQLFNGETDIDHIIPRQRYFDDSYNNKVLCFRNVNEEKSNMTSYEFMQQKGIDKWEDFTRRVNELYKEGLISKKKKNYLLSDEIPKDFINRQLNETRYITRRVKEELEKISPVVTTVGSITDYLKEDWKLNKVFKEVQLGRFRSIEKKIDKKLIQEIRINGYHDYQIEGWDKRIDHRHHALDAITIACTNRSIIQTLNNLAQLYESSEPIKNKISRHFPVPAPDFRDQVKNTLETMIVSHKSRRRLITKKRAYYKVLDPSTGAYILKKQEKPSPVVRGPLHDEQPLGEIKEYQKIKIKDAIKKLEENKNNLDKFINGTFPIEWQRKKINEKLSIYNNDPKLFLKNLNKDAILNLKGEKLEYITILVRKYVKSRDLNTSITLSQIENIIDRKLKNEIKNHLKQYNNDPKKAFTDEGLMLFNQNRKFPVYKVRCKVDESEVGTLTTREPLERDSENNPKLHIEKGENYGFVIYENKETGKREYETISFYDAISLARMGLSIVEARPGYRHCVLKHNELIYVLRPGEEKKLINWNDYKNLNNRIYRIVKFTNKRLYAVPHQVAENIVLNEEYENFNEFGSNKNCLEIISDDEPKTKISERCIKINADRLGNIKPAPWEND